MRDIWFPTNRPTPWCRASRNCTTEHRLNIRGERRTCAAELLARGAVAVVALIALATIVRGLGPVAYAAFALVYAAVAISGAALLHHFVAGRDARLEPISLRWTPVLHLFGAPLALTTFSLALLRWADRFVLAGYVDAANLGIYAAAVDLAQWVFVVVIGSLYHVWLPRLTVDLHDTDPRIRTDTASRYALLLIALLLPALTGLALLRIDIVETLFGSEYAAQAALLPWVVLAVALGLLRTFVLDVGLYIVGRAGAVTRNVLVSAVIGFILNVLCVPRYGVSAAIAASLVTQSIALALAWFSGRDVINWRIPRMHFERILFSCGLMVLPLLLMPHGGLLAFGARASVAVAVYGVAMLLVNGVDCRTWLLAGLRRRTGGGGVAP